MLKLAIHYSVPLVTDIKVKMKSLFFIERLTPVYCQWTELTNYITSVPPAMMEHGDCGVELTGCILRCLHSPLKRCSSLSPITMQASVSVEYIQG
ncbi:hypothetical protein CEXT_498761 [Caerostris extrusa]|uniref:Uncharacterized protein n=1 Tax=Caerostris extrusa TaxID=172846 RepID=A0AAV4NBL5_CAEEX|nr:hypothetical protein CEXT_498761 [Caerostris extrusa]